MAPRSRGCYKNREEETEDYSVSVAESEAGIEEEVIDESEKNDNGGCTTPKGARFRIPKTLSCPPAPMKKKTSTSSRLLKRSSSPIAFFAPPDSELFFLFSLHK